MNDRTITFLIDHTGDKLNSFEATLTYELTSDEIVRGIEVTKLLRMLNTAAGTALAILKESRMDLFETLLSENPARYTEVAMLNRGSVTVVVKAGWV